MNCCRGTTRSQSPNDWRRKGVVTERRLDSAALANIQSVIDGGGQIMIGTVAPIRGAAVAHDGHKTLVMLRRQSRETIPDLLARLDAAILTAMTTGTRVDEINTEGSSRRYEL